MKKILILFLFITALFSKETITIVYNSGTPPLKFTDEKGNPNGMLIDIWKLWAKKNNIDVKFVELPWEETIEAIESGKADIHGGIYYTKERDKFLDYPKKPLFENKKYFFYYRRLEAINSPKDFSPFVIGVDNGYPIEFMKEKYPNSLIKAYDSADELNHAFVNGDLKVMLASHSTFLYYLKKYNIDESNFKYSENTFAYEKDYFGAVKKGNKKLLKLINEGFKNITDDELKEIELRWTVKVDINYLKGTKENTQFKKEYKEYLSDKRVIKMCVDPEWLPFEKIEDGKHKGMIAELYTYFKDSLNIPIELVQTKTWTESIALAKSKECDILSAVAITPKRLEYLNFTKPYMKFPQVLVTREKEDFIDSLEEVKDKKIGIVKNSAVAELLKNKYKGINLVETKSVVDGLFKVSSGELYGFVNTSAATNYAVAKNGLTNLKIASKAGIDYYLRIGVRDDDKQLLDLFNSAILQLDKNIIQESKNKWLHIKVEQVVDYSLLWKVLLGALLILSIVVFFLIKQNRLKQKIEEQKKTFEDLYQKSTDPILLMENGKLVDCNEATIKILGYISKEEFLNQHPSKLSPIFQADGRNSYEKANEHLENALKNGQDRFEWLHTKATGENIWMDVSLTKINQNEKDIIHVVWRDIQERKEMERELISEKEQLDKILSNTPVPVLIVSKDSKKILFANNYACKVYELGLEELLNSPIDIVYTKDSQREEILNALDDDGVLINHETSYKSKSGKHIDALLSLIPIKFKGESANVGVITDVTKLKQIQKELEAESKKAKDATSAKSDFLAKMSHEIRTPMNAILGMLYLVEKTSLNSMQESYIQKANSATRALLNIVDDILDISKIEAGKLNLEYNNFQFNDMLHDIMGILSYRAEEKGLELLAYYDDQIPRVLKSDKLRIGQILNNLIGNAIKFTSKGEIVISTKVIKKDDEKVTIMFCVKDSGIGISKDAQDKLFQDFSQVDDSITRKYGGTGLGLAISKKLSDMLGGRIWIEESLEGVGTTFCFTVVSEYEKELEESVKFPAEINNLNVLIIDDNEIAADVLSCMLKSFGFSVDIAYNGNEGYKKVLQSDIPYDIIFLDYKMPELNGIETYKMIKSVMGESIPKTIMVTANSQSEVIKEAKQIGICGYLIKPAAPSTLYDTIIDIISPNKELNKEKLKDKNESVDFHGAKVLLVEDNELNQDFAIQLLESVNLDVTIANDGIESLDKIRDKNYDVVLMDIQMPNMDGLTATKQIRKMGHNDSYFEKIPIIALSANALAEDRAKSIETGMDEHISKPIEPEELFEVLNRYINSSAVSVSDNLYNENIKKLKDNVDPSILNYEEILSRIDGNYDTYVKLLKKFVKKYDDVDEFVINLVNNDNLDDAGKKIHEIKGVAGNLGVDKLFKVLATLNYQLREEIKPTNQLLKEFSMVLNETITHIKDNIDQEESNEKEFDKGRVLEKLSFIESNIDDDIMACGEALNEIEPYVINSLYSDNFKIIQELYDEFDTDTMIEKIIELIKEINEA
jgi:polar amino acid transport system substrate-binding protein